jgi:hypothetical protein
MWIHIYKGSVTSGAKDGTAVSEGTGADPISSGVLNATINQESNAIKLAVRCDDGVQTSGNTTIQPFGTSASKWSLAPDSGNAPGTWGAYGEALVISTVIGSTNTIFWAKAKATSDETPSMDDATDFRITTTVTSA